MKNILIVLIVGIVGVPLFILLSPVMLAYFLGLLFVNIINSCTDIRFFKDRDIY